MKTDLMNTMDDEMLWILLVKGNKDVIEIFYRRHYNLLFSYGMNLYPDKELIRDCIQDLFVKIFHSDKLSITPSVRAYLLKGIKNLIYDKAGTFSKHQTIQPEHLTIELDEDTLQTLFSKNDTDLHRSKQLARVFNNLPVQQRNAIYLRFIKALSYKEIAGIMEINTQSCMNLISRALRKFREEIK